MEWITYETNERTHNACYVKRHAKRLGEISNAVALQNLGTIKTASVEILSFHTSLVKGVRKFRRNVCIRAKHQIRNQRRMNDFKSIIKRNLSPFPGIVDKIEVIAEIDSLIQRIGKLGYHKLIDNFCNQTDPDRAIDFLFELWICDLLINDDRVENLQYEPEEESSPPDFRFNISDCQFDLQVKRLHQIKNEITKSLFKRECEARLSKIQKPWFINFWVSDAFERKHLNQFFQDIRLNIDNYRVTDDISEAVRANKYAWKSKDNQLVRFSFMKKNNGELGIAPGIIHEMGTEDDLFAAIDTKSVRKSIERLLKRSRGTLQRPVSEIQSNLVVIQAESNVNMINDVMADVLYGDELTQVASLLDGSYVYRNSRANNGLFAGEAFSTINGVILVSEKATPLDKKLAGNYYANLQHQKFIKSHPISFRGVPFLILNEWRFIEQWQPLKESDR